MIKGLRDQLRLVANGTSIDDTSVLLINNDTLEEVGVTDIKPLYDDILVASYEVSTPGNWLAKVVIGDYVEYVNLRIAEEPDWMVQSKTKGFSKASSLKLTKVIKGLTRRNMLD